MDRRQERTREAIFWAFKELLSEQDYADISVGAICARARVGRTTFYAHYPTKDALLDDVCASIFHHVFTAPEGPEATHDYSGRAGDIEATVAHLLHHIADNDLGVADLLRGRSSELVSTRLQRRLFDLAKQQMSEGDAAGIPHGDAELPRSFLAHHFAVSLMGTIHWWLMHDMHDDPATVAAFFAKVMD
jgi:AcrR family transcriptional regulator